MSRASKYLALLFLGWALLPVALMAGGTGNWQQTQGPPGARVYALELVPGQPERLYAGTNAGLYYSADGGHSWQHLFGHEVRALCMDPRDSDRLYAGTAEGQVWQSRDGGTTWLPLDAHLPPKIIWALVAHPTIPDRLYLGSDTLYQSRDGGHAWTAAALPASVGRVSSIALLQDGNETLVLGTDAGLFISRDGGHAWQQAGREALGSASVEALLAVRWQAAPSALLLAGTSGGLFHSWDGGLTWEGPAPDIGPQLVSGLAHAQDGIPLLYAGAQDASLYRSQDNGDTWQATGAPLSSGAITDLALDAARPDRVYVGTGAGIYGSNDGGATWEGLGRGLVATNVQALSLGPDSPHHVLAATRWGLYHTLDGGGTWEPVEATQGLNATALAKNANDLYLGTWEGQLYRSQDGGATWHMIHREVSNGAPIAALSVQPGAGQGSDTLFVGTNGAGVLSSQDGGQSWAMAGTGLAQLHVSALALSPSPPALYAGTSAGLYRLELQEMAGSPWQRVGTIPQEAVRGVAVAPSGAVWAATGDALYTSRDGLAWSSTGEDSLRAYDVVIQTFSLPEGDKGKSLYLGTDGGILASQDSGRSWAMLQEGLDCDLLVAWAGTPNMLYAGIRDAGVWRGEHQPQRGLGGAWVLVLGILAAGGAGLAAWKLYPRQAPPLPVQSLEAHWPEYDAAITRSLKQAGEAMPETLGEIPDDLRLAALQCYVEVHPDKELVWDADASLLQIAEPRRIKALLGNWQAAQDSLDDGAKFRAAATRIANQLCNYLGFERTASRTYRNLNGFVVEGPTLRLRVPPRFPLIFLRSQEPSPDDVLNLRNMMDVLHMTSYFALVFVVSPDLEAVGQLRELVRASTHDFVVLGFEDVFEVVTARQKERQLTRILLKQVDLTVVSPYVTNGPVPENMFFGRDTEIKAITRTIQDKSFALVGGRKIGKTSVLTQAHRILQQTPGYAAFYLDCQAVYDYGAFFQALQARWGLEEVPGPEEPGRFDQVVAALREASGDKAHLVILLDEVDALLAHDVEHQEALFSTFRALSQENRCRFVFCGERVLHDRLQDAGSPLFNFCEQLLLGFLDRDAARRVIAEPMEEMGIAFDDKAKVLEEMLDVSSCHPNLVQYICQQMLVEINGQQPRQITSQVLRKVIQTRYFADYYLSVTWGSATPLEKLITLLMLDQPLLTVAELLERLRQEQSIALDQEQAEEALEHLVLCSVLDRQRGYYAFAAQAFPDVVESTQDVPVLMENIKAQIQADVQDPPATSGVSDAT